MIDVLVSFALVCLGLVLLGASQSRHWRRIAGPRLLTARRIRLLRASGSVLLVASLLISIVVSGPSFGSLLWATLLSIAGLATTLTLSLRPHWLRSLAWAGLTTSRRPRRSPRR